MITKHRRLQGLGLIFLTGMTCLAPLAKAGEDEPAARPGLLQVSDGAGKLILLSAKDWAKLPRSKVEVKGKDDATARYEGVSLAEVLRLAGVSFEDHPRGRAAAYVLVEGSDGYRAVLALAEVDPKVADRLVLLADRLDGKPLADKTGPYRLVVTGDKVPVRWVKQVSRIGLRHPADDVANKKK
jgi:DMSO/TMAO reductase YedYZ molybdopterin-dependent catalytic subunit